MTVMVWKDFGLNVNLHKCVVTKAGQKPGSME
jgi:hypothetical protein